MFKALQSLQGEVKTVNSGIAHLTEVVGVVQTAIVAMQTTIVAMQTAIASLQADVREIRRDVSDLRSSMTDHLNWHLGQAG